MVVRGELVLVYGTVPSPLGRGVEQCFKRSNQQGPPVDYGPF
jgi:hypothetical protein